MTHQPLIEKLEAAESGSRELDVAIWAALHPERIKVIDFWEVYNDEKRTAIGFSLPPKRLRNTTQKLGPYPHAEPVTTSLDAALALAGRVLPGWRFAMATIAPPWVQAYPPDSVEDCLDAVAASTLPLALCIAILRAHEAKR